jgi:hypothetical protein
MERKKERRKLNYSSPKYMHESCSESHEDKFWSLQTLPDEDNECTTPEIDMIAVTSGVPSPNHTKYDPLFSLSIPEEVKYFLTYI